MSATNQFETDLLELLFLNTTLANIGDATGLVGSTTAGSLYVSLSTGVASDTTTDQNSFECDYTGYSRQAVARSGAGWTVTGDTADNAALLQFGQKTGGADDSVQSALIGTDSSGAGYAMLYGSASLTVSDGVNPQFAIGALDVQLS